MARHKPLRRKIIIAVFIICGLILTKSVCFALFTQAVGGGSFSSRLKDEFIDPGGMNRLHYAARDQEPFWVKFYLTLGWSPNSTDNHGQTPLHQALYYAKMNQTNPSQLRVVEILLEAGSNINAQDKDGKTPLMQAAFNAQSEMAGFLIKIGADVNMLDRKFKTALDHSRSIATKPITQELRKYGAEFGAEVNQNSGEFTIRPKGTDFETIKIPSASRAIDIEAEWVEEYQGYVLEFIIDTQKTCEIPENCNEIALNYLTALTHQGAKVKRKQGTFRRIAPIKGIKQKQFDEAYYWSITDCKTPFYADISNASKNLRVRIFITQKPFSC